MNETCTSKKDPEGCQTNNSKDRSNFFDLTQQPCTFVPIVTMVGFDANYFINDTSPVEPPDDE